MRTTRTDPSAPPSRHLLMLEGRGIWELGAFFAAYPLLQLGPRGDGHPVLMLPGMATSDASTRPLRSLLNNLGYRSHGWALGANQGPRPGVEARLHLRLEELALRFDEKISLIGWSLGGIFAREMAAPRAGAGMPKIEDLGKLVAKFKLPGIDVAAIVESQRNDMEALVEANRQAFEGIQALAKRRNELLKEAFTQWQAATKDSTGSGALGKQAALAKKGVQKAIADVRELADMEAASRKTAWKLVQDRFDENLGNLKKLIQPEA